MGTMRTWRIVNDSVEVLINGEWGDIVPNQFARDIYNESDWQNIQAEDIKVLKEGPDNSDYENAWKRVVENAVCTHREYPGWTLRYNGVNLYLCENDEHWQAYLLDDSIE